jgi:hypothetical protein
MRAVIGSHQAGLGEASNEKSGRAILARQREGDVGTFVYLDNFARAVRHTGVILLDLIPHIYDTERTIRIVGEDGRMTPLRVNQAVGMVVSEEDDGGEGDDGEAATAQKLNDLSIGAYDVVIEQGPSYSTKREEAKDGMATLVQAVPSTFGLIGDLYVQAQDWPMKDQIAKRLKMGLPPAIRQMEAQGSGAPPSPQPPPQPSPEAIAAQQQAQAQGARIQMDGAKIQSQIATEEQQRRIDLARAQSDLADAENARVIAAQEAENAARRTEAEIALIEARRALALAQIGALGRDAGQAEADMTMAQHDAALREAQVFAADIDGL